MDGKVDNMQTRYFASAALSKTRRREVSRLYIKKPGDMPGFSFFILWAIRLSEWPR